MEEKREQGLDPEQFARVWGRVTEGTNGSRVMPTVSSAPRQCLGQESACYETFLRRRIREELIDWRSCAVLSGRGVGWQVLRAIAGEELRQARRLSTACFLITGERYFPREDSAPLSWRRWEDGMRTMFHRSQKGAEEYHRAADQTRDACLRELFQSLAEEENLHALRIRTVLEGTEPMGNCR